MSQDLDLESIRQALKQLETSLLDRLQAGSDEPSEPVPDQSEPGLGTLYESWVQRRTISQGDAEQLEQIQAALRRLEDGTYGKCIKCGAQINPERLNSLPYAELCISCQRKQEDPLA